MKKLYIFLLVGIIATASSCTYTFPEDEAPTSGTADFTKVVAVGNSLTAGYMNGALYDDGQAASYANIVAQQIKLNGGGDFNQPDIKSPLGYFGTAMGIPGVPDGTPLGRLHLVNPSNPAPQPIIPGDPFNTSYGGDKSALNNFGVPGARIVDAGFPGYGTLNPYFERFASDPATASMLGDAVAANGSFFIFWLGANDALGYAAGGATGNPDGDGTNPADMTQSAIFSAAYSAAIDAMTANGAKGIVANVPSINNIPHFTTVPWNAIVFDPDDPNSEIKVDALNQGFAELNHVFDTLYQLPLGLDSTDMVRRKIKYDLGPNPVLIEDEKLIDLGPYFDILASSPEERAQLEPYRTSRPMTNLELLTLTAGSTLAKDSIPQAPEGTTPIGVVFPLNTKYTLSDADQIEIADRIEAFNDVIAGEVSASNGNLVLLDINTIFADFVKTGTTINGAGMDATILPPFGAFSLDGVHPNQRGSAWMASLFIDKINEAFGANIPNVNPNNWPGNALPVPN